MSPWIHTIKSESTMEYSWAGIVNEIRSRHLGFGLISFMHLLITIGPLIRTLYTLYFSCPHLRIAGWKHPLAHCTYPIWANNGYIHSPICDMIASIVHANVNYIATIRVIMFAWFECTEWVKQLYAPCYAIYVWAGEHAFNVSKKG